MASQTRYGIVSPYNAIDTSCGQLTGSGYRTAQIGVFAIPADATNLVLTLFVDVSCQELGDSPEVNYTLKGSDDGSTFCSGHAESVTTDAGCGTTVHHDSAVCSHGESPTTIAELNRVGNSYRNVRITWVSGDFLFINRVGMTVSYTVPTAPSVPADPSITADGVGDATVSSTHGESGLIDVQQEVSTSSTFASSVTVWRKYGAPDTPQTHQFTGLSADGLYYARVKYLNGVNWSAYNAYPYNSDRIWDQSNAPTWQIPTFTARTATSITLDWIQPTDLGNSTLDDYRVYYEAGDSTPDTFVDTGSSNSIYTKGSLSPGTLYYFNVAAWTQWGLGLPTASVVSHRTLCATPVISSVVANAKGQLRVSWTTVTGVSHWELEKSPNGTDTWTTVDLAIPSTTLYKDVGSLGDGQDWWFRLRATNVDSYDSLNSDTESGITWDVPDNQDLSSATTPSASMIRITRNSTYPDGNGEAVDSWELWRCSTDVGTYILIDDGLTSTTYDDWDVNGGETWYYKAKFTNLVGDSTISTNSVSDTVDYARITKSSNVSIYMLQQITKASNLRINITFQSTKSSNLRVKTFNNQISKSSNLVIRLTSQLSKPSNLKIIATQQIQKISNLAVKVFGLQQTKSSNLRIKITPSPITKSSNLKVLVWRATFTPLATFTKYELNDGVVSTIDEELNLGAWEGFKTMTCIAVDPYENTMVNPDKHEMYYAVSPEGGNENFYQLPLTNGLVSIVDEEPVFETGYRGIGYGQQSWGIGVTTLEVEINVNDGLGGTKINLTGTWSNPSTAWSPPSGSGTDVMDVPTVYNGSCVVVVQPTDWDGNTDHKMHDWLPLQVSVGHAVEVKDYTEFYSGTHEDSEINLQGHINANGTPYDISFKVYHEAPKEWEWYSGATKIDSGTLTPNKNTWQMLDNLNMGSTHLSGTVAFVLKLYARSGSVLHPNPIRVMTVNRII